jgi:hypothetical protein
MPRRCDRDEDDEAPQRLRPRRKRGWTVSHWIGLTVGVLGVVGAAVAVVLLVRGGGGGTSPTEVVQKLVQAADRKDWSAAFDLIAPEAQKRIADGIREWMRTVPVARPYADGSDRAVYTKMCKERDGLEWPHGVNAQTAVVSEDITGDRCVVTVSAGNNRTTNLICIKIGKRWYLTDR